MQYISFLFFIRTINHLFITNPLVNYWLLIDH